MTSKQSIDELDKILGKMTVMPYDEGYQEAKTALNQYYLSVFMNLIGEDETDVAPSTNRDWDIPVIRNELRQELRAIAKEKLNV